MEPGVDQADDLEGGQWPGDTIESVGLGRVCEAEAMLARSGSLECEVPGACW